MYLPAIVAVSALFAAANAIPRGPVGPTGSPLCQPGCPSDEVCIPKKGDNTVGECFKPKHKCSGFMGSLCPDTENLKCIDDPRDSCDPLARAADCIGVCVPR